jgi:hypothetical protein
MAGRQSRIDAFDFPPGRVLAGKYQVEDFLGSGYEAEVYRVSELRTGIRRAAKIFYPQRNPRDRAVRFYARKLDRLRKCPILIQYHHTESFWHRNTRITYLLGELVEGELLEEFVARQPGKRLHPFEGLHLLHTLAAGVEQIHNLKEYHGDIHDRNVIVARQGIRFDVKLLDFYEWGQSGRSNMRDDVIQLVRLLYDVLGGRKRYSRQPREVKAICCGLRRDLIRRRFPTAGHLRRYLESFSWDSGLR